MQNKQQWTIAGTVGTAAVVIGLWTSLNPWPYIGWETPNRHHDDIAAMQSKLESDIANTQTTLQIFRDEWACSLFTKDLTALYEKANSAGSRRLTDQIQRLREKMDTRMCERFGDY